MRLDVSSSNSPPVDLNRDTGEREGFSAHPASRTSRVNLNPNLHGLEQSPTLEINSRVRALRGQGRDVITLGFGQSPFPVPDAVVESLRRHAAEKDYLDVQGLPALRDAVADHHRRIDGVHARAADVLVGPGSKELMFLLQLAFGGDLIVPSPSWVSYVPQARILGKAVQVVPTSYEDRWRVTDSSLGDFLSTTEDPRRPRLLILNFPSNPHGGSYAPEELKALAAVVRKHGVVVLADEIYGLLHNRGEHASLARYYPEGTILSSGLSKWCGAGGWRLGTFTFPAELDWLLQAMRTLASETYTSVSAPIQYAAVTAFQGSPEIERYLEQSRRVLTCVAAACAEQLRAAGLRVHEAHGGFYLFPDFGPFAERLSRIGVETSASLCTRVLEDLDVAMLPGSAFNRPDTELTVRLAYVDFDGGAALAASGAIPGGPLPRSFAAAHCPRVQTAMTRLAGWLDALE